MMDSDEDDIYPDHDGTNGQRYHEEVKMEDVEDGEEEGEEVEEDEEESDDEVHFITDAKEEQPKQEPGSQAKRQPVLAHTAADSRRASSTPTPVVKSEAKIDSQGESQPPDDRPGTDFPARHTSKIDPNGNPVHPATGKPILSTNFDVDFPSDSTKPWRKPGADITDYFNYGFDEYTFAYYCLKQQQMPKEVKALREETEQMKSFVENIATGGMPSMPPLPGAPAGVSGGMAQMPGMPSEAEMQQMFQTMMSQGIDPTTMDANQFAQMMMGSGAGMMGQPQPPTGPAASFGGGGGFDQGGGFGRGGRGKGGRRNW